MTVNMRVPSVVSVAVVLEMNHRKTLYYNITDVYRSSQRTAAEVGSRDSSAGSQTKRAAARRCRPQNRLSPRSGFREHFFDVFPVNEVVEERLQVVGATVAIIDIV